MVKVKTPAISYKALEAILEDYEKTNPEVPLTAQGFLSLVHEKLTGRIKLKNFQYEDDQIYIL